MYDAIVSMENFCNSAKNLEKYGGEIAKELSSGRLKAFGREVGMVIGRDVEEQEKWEEMVRKLEEVENFLSREIRKISDSRESLED